MVHPPEADHASLKSHVHQLTHAVPTSCPAEPQAVTRHASAAGTPTQSLGRCACCSASLNSRAGHHTTCGVEGEPTGLAQSPQHTACDTRHQPLTAAARQHTATHDNTQPPSSPGFESYPRALYHTSTLYPLHHSILRRHILLTGTVSARFALSPSLKLHRQEGYAWPPTALYHTILLND